MSSRAANDVIHVACQADHRYAPDCAVMLHSLFTVNSGETFEIHFLHDATLPAEDLEGLAEIAARFGMRWSPRVMRDEQMSGLPFSRHYGGYAACYRLLLPELLPQLSRVLYLDADILHVDRLRPLWELALGGHCLAAVTNSLFADMEHRVRTTLGVPDAQAYFNSGVLLLDLARLRHSGLAGELLAFAREQHARIVWPDQDPLNAVLWKHRLPLHPRWNATNGLFHLPRRYLAWPPEQIGEAQARPAIVHFVGSFKPRHYRLEHPFKSRYHGHLRQTRWRDHPLEGRTLRNMLFKPLPVLWQWRIEAGAGRVAAVARKIRARVIRKKT